MKYSFYLTFLLLPATALAQAGAGKHSQQAAAVAPGAGHDGQRMPVVKKGQTLSYKALPAAGNTWGYEVLVNGVPYIRQLSVPGAPGNAGFGSRAQAEATARLVMDKLGRNENPPNVSEQELEHIRTTIK